jgi:hypothetical protein
MSDGSSSPGKEQEDDSTWFSSNERYDEPLEKLLHTYILRFWFLPSGKENGALRVHPSYARYVRVWRSSSCWLSIYALLLFPLFRSTLHSLLFKTFYSSFWLLRQLIPTNQASVALHSQRLWWYRRVHVVDHALITSQAFTPNILFFLISCI